MSRVRVDGKYFARGDHRFLLRGVTYGTFAPRADGQQLPERDRMKRDLAAIRDAHFNAIRTYTSPSDDLLELASDWGLQVVAGLFVPDWRYSMGCSRRGWRRTARTARREIRRQAQRLADCDDVLAVVIGNELPADVVRWYGANAVEDVLADMVDVVHSEDDRLLVTYGNFPTTEYLSLPTLDFLMFNVYLDDPADLRRYLTRLHHLAGNRPLVLGEVGAMAERAREGERRQAERLASQLEVALERGVAGTCVFSWTDDWWVGGAPIEDWRFGLTRRDRSPRPALRAATRANCRTVRDVAFDWPSISVIVCAYNAAETIDECLQHTCALEYPDLEIIVVDDGSEDATREIVARHPRARLMTIPHAGLAVARNRGFEAATGDLIVYLDSDAYPVPEWPWYLALAFDGPRVAGAGGPNIPPSNACRAAHAVAHAPGGPVHVLVSDNRAEHIPGCNMAFWRDRIAESGGFDPIFTAAGDDVDFCWRVLDRGHEISFHPAAAVFHHRRSGMRTYLKQQRGYGRSEALIEARHPDRYNTVGSARWRGRVYATPAPVVRGRIYRGPFATAAYQSVYRVDAHGFDLTHQAGVPIAVVVAAAAPSALVWPLLLVPVAVALLFLTLLFAVDARRAVPPKVVRGAQLRFRMTVAALQVLQPVARQWGRRRTRVNDEFPAPELEFALHRGIAADGVVSFQTTEPRDRVAASVVATARRSGVRVLCSSGWDAFDARLLGSWTVVGELFTSAYPEGIVQTRIRRRPRWGGVLTATVVISAALAVTPVAAAAAAVLFGADVVRGWWRTGPLVRRAIRREAG